MLSTKLFMAASAAVAVAFSAGYASAQEFTAHLRGFNEIGSIPTSVTVSSLGSPTATGYTGAVMSDGKGTAKLYLDKNAGTITYTLTYSKRRNHAAAKRARCRRPTFISVSPTIPVAFSCSSAPT